MLCMNKHVLIKALFWGFSTWKMLRKLHKVHNKTPLIEPLFNKALKIDSSKDVFV